MTKPFLDLHAARARIKEFQLSEQIRKKKNDASCSESMFGTREKILAPSFEPAPERAETPSKDPERERVDVDGDDARKPG